MRIENEGTYATRDGLLVDIDCWWDRYASGGGTWNFDLDRIDMSLENDEWPNADSRVYNGEIRKYKRFPRGRFLREAPRHMVAAYMMRVVKPVTHADEHHLFWQRGLCQVHVVVRDRRGNRLACKTLGGVDPHDWQARLAEAGIVKQALAYARGG